MFKIFFSSSISLVNEEFSILANFSLTGFPSSSIFRYSKAYYYFLLEFLCIIPESLQLNFSDQEWCIPPGNLLRHSCKKNHMAEEFPSSLTWWFDSPCSVGGSSTDILTLRVGLSAEVLALLLGVETRASFQIAPLFSLAWKTCFQLFLTIFSVCRFVVRSGAELMWIFLRSFHFLYFHYFFPYLNLKLK